MAGFLAATSRRKAGLNLVRAEKGFAITVRFALAADSPLWPQTAWQAPAPPDASTSITVGDSYKIKWNSDLYTAFAQYAPSADPTNVALWVTTSVNNQDPIRVQSSVNVKDTLSLDWNVSIPSAELTNNGVWTLKFIPADAASPGATTEQVSSPWFVVREGAAPASTSTTTSASASTASAKPTTSTSTTESSTPNPTASPGSSSGLSDGAISGIVIGAIAVVVMTVGIFFFLRYKKRAQSAPWSGLAPDDGQEMTNFKNLPPYYPPPNQTYPTSAVQSQPYLHPSELDGSH